MRVLLGAAVCFLVPISASAISISGEDFRKALSAFSNDAKPVTIEQTHKLKPDQGYCAVSSVAPQNPENYYSDEARLSVKYVADPILGAYVILHTSHFSGGAWYMFSLSGRMRVSKSGELHGYRSAADSQGSEVHTTLRAITPEANPVWVQRIQTITQGRYQSSRDAICYFWNDAE